MVNQTNGLLMLLIGLLIFVSATKATQANYVGSSRETFIDQCTPVPTWTIGRGQAVSLVGQNLTVIALLNSNRLDGRKQAAMLNSLRSRLYQTGFPAINFMLINSMMATENTQLLRHEAATIPVYQEQPEEPVRGILGAAGDHVLVLDRCGRMAYQVISPFSRLTYPYVKAAILSTYKDNPCGLCNATEHTKESRSLGMVYVSDAPDHADGQFINLQNENIIEPSSLEPLEGHTVNQSYTARGYTARNTPQNENGLVQSFVPNFGVQDSQEGSSTEGISLRMKDNIPTDLVPKASLHRLHLPFNYRTHEERARLKNAIIHRNVHNNGGHFKNWAGSQRINDQSGLDSEALLENGESVEVVHHIKHPQERKAKKLGETMDPTATSNQTLKCEALEQCSSPLSNTSTTVLLSDSMEELVNDTQKLFDWYQRKTERFILNEERSNVLRRRLIEHYSKLLPWLHFRLAPESEI